MLSQWIKAHPDAINTGNQSVDQILTVLLSTTMFLSGLIGFILDNTVPGMIKKLYLISVTYFERVINKESAEK